MNTDSIYKIISVEDFSPRDLPVLHKLHRPRGNPGQYKNKPDYYDIVCAFDTETSYLKDYDESVMYIWQWAFNDICVYGRTWDQFVEFLATLQRFPYTFVTYVHNLSFEFQFLSGILHFRTDDVFCVKSRHVLKATYNNVEFRCSYLHSNMSLDKFIKHVGGQYKKLELDYSVVRYPWTPLTEKELQYCVNDVIGLTSAISIEMQRDGDTLYTIPATSTGYLRREAKRALQKWRRPIQGMRADYDLQVLLKKAFRGGDTHANRRYSGYIVEGVHSTDRSSSYPDVMVNCEFPMTAFLPMGYIDLDHLEQLIGRKALLIECAVAGLRLRSDLEPCPYISLSKCDKIDHVICDNGRVMQALYLEMVITDVDYRIIKDCYEWDSLVIKCCWQADYGYLPEPLRDLMRDYYRRKTTLKGDPEQGYYYTKSKNKLNAGFGMCAQDPMPDNIIFDPLHPENNGGFRFHPADPEKWDSAKNKYWLHYAWGVWVTAWARYRLWEGRKIIQAAGGAWIYGDTDSHKYIGTVSFEAYNAERIKESTKNGAYAVDARGKTHYMGVYEYEGQSLQFRTWGAKKYAYIDRQGMHLTVSGVNKKLGAAELVQAARIRRHLTGSRENALDVFVPSYYDDYMEKVPGFVFREGGGTESRYDDTIDLHTIVDGHELHITRNVSIVPSTYELSLTSEYRDLIHYQVINGTEDVLHEI